MTCLRSSSANRLTTSFCETVETARDAFVGRLRALTQGRAQTHHHLSIGSMFLFSVALIGFTRPPLHGASYTLNVSLSTSAANPSALQQALLSDLTTGPYLGIAKPSPFFANTYSVTLNGKNPNYLSPSGSTANLTMDGLLRRLESTTTDYFLYGYLTGMQNERQNDLYIMGGYGLNCSTPTAFVRQSTTTAWNVAQCMDAINTVYRAIYQQYQSTPVVVVPGF